MSSHTSALVPLETWAFSSPILHIPDRVGAAFFDSSRHKGVVIDFYHSLID